MTQEEKQLLLKDLCARLPYGLKVEVYVKDKDIKSVDYVKYDTVGTYIRLIDDENFSIKSYLRPMSSMTEEEKKEFIEYAGYEIEESVNGRHYEYYLKDFCGTPDNPSVNADGVDWLNKKMFDYRGLIPMGLALEAPKDMYNTKTE